MKRTDEAQDGAVARRPGDARECHPHPPGDSGFQPFSLSFPPALRPRIPRVPSLLCNAGTAWRGRTGATEDSGCGRLMSTLRNNNNKIGQDARHRAQGAGGGKGPGAASTRHRQHAGLGLACASCLYVLLTSVRAAKALARDLQGRQDVSAKDSRAAAHPCDADLCFLRCRWRRTRRQICRQKCARAKPMSSIT